MIGKYLIPAIIFGLFISLHACNDSADTQSDSQDENSVILTEENNDTTVEIDIEEEIVIELQSNPSTGYHWEHSNTDGTFIYQDGESIFIEDEECAGAEGCGGIERFTFVASRTGTGAIALAYRRTSEESPIDQFSVDVIVTN